MKYVYVPVKVYTNGAVAVKETPKAYRVEVSENVHIWFAKSLISFRFAANLVFICMPSWLAQKENLECYRAIGNSEDASDMLFVVA